MFFHPQKKNFEVSQKIDNKNIVQTLIVNKKDRLSFSKDLSNICEYYYIY